MRNNLSKFENAVKYYTKYLKGKVEDKTLFINLDLKYKDAFFSLAPLTRAAHNMEADVHIIIHDEKSFAVEILHELWGTFDELKKGNHNNKIAALKGFIDSVNKKTKSKEFYELFEKPEIILSSNKHGFDGTFKLPYFSDWRVIHRWKELLQTCDKIWKEGYNLSKKDNVGIGFVSIPSKQDTKHPVDDYLDSFSIAYAMALSAKHIGAKISLETNSDRFSVLSKPVRTTDLLMTIKGCELSKDINEEVFRKYRTLSKLFNGNRFEFITAGFSIHGRGYYGKHFFGDNIGYPTPNLKTRWNSPSQILLKDKFSPQTKYETREPRMRYAITETLPLDIFIDTCNLDYHKIRERSKKIRNIFNKCSFIRVIGKEINEYQTDFKVELIRKDGWRRDFLASDSNVRTIIDQDGYKKTGQKTGAFANFPSGETFCTPESVDGVIIGDIVINIDQSYTIPKKDPIIIKMNNGTYKILKAHKKIMKIVKKEKKEVWQKIKMYEKSKSIPMEIINIYKRNFDRIGEFAVNTNPKAKLCDYLIVNEKIARMLHIALGSGFEPDTKTLYHWDIVVNAPKQKVDLYGIDKNGKIHWVIKKGNFVV